MKPTQMAPVLLALLSVYGCALEVEPKKPAATAQALETHLFEDGFSGGLQNWQTERTVSIDEGSALLRGGASMETTVSIHAAADLLVRYTRRTASSGTDGSAEVSLDGGASYQLIDTWSNTDDERMRVLVDVSGAVGDEMRLRFRCQNRIFFADRCRVDDVVIDTDCRDGSCAPIDVDPGRSLLVTDLAVLGEDTDGAGDFTLERTLSMLGSRLDMSAEQMFVNLWETQRPDADGGRCQPGLNGFEHQCRPGEGDQIDDAVDAMARYRPTGLVNRLDLASADGSDCGEFRVIYARRRSGLGRLRSLVIFEARMPNPTGDPAMCLPLQRYWADLSLEPDASVRAARLEDFFYRGVQGFPPAIRFEHFTEAGTGAASGGQVRLNLFIDRALGWDLQDIKLDASSGFEPTFVRRNPVGFLFDDRAVDSVAGVNRGVEFRAAFLDDMGSLLGNIDEFGLTVANPAHNNNQSHSSDGRGDHASENRYLEHASPAFRTQVGERLTELGSELTVDQLLNRAVANTCAGCHEPTEFGLTDTDALGEGMSFPDSLGFIHVGDRVSGDRFPISPALEDLFLPARKRLLDGLLNTTTGTPWAPTLLAPDAPAGDEAIDQLSAGSKRSG